MPTSTCTVCFEQLYVWLLSMLVVVAELSPAVMAAAAAATVGLCGCQLQVIW